MGRNKQLHILNNNQNKAVMKQFIYLTLAIVLMSCSKDNEFTTPQDTVPFTFSMKGDFTISTTPMTRALSADGKDLTDL